MLRSSFEIVRCRGTAAFAVCTVKLPRRLESTASILKDVRPTDTPVEAYTRLVQTGKLRADSKQLAAVKQLDRVHGELRKAQEQQNQGWLSSLFTRHALSLSKPPPMKGLYMYGGVGCGKTLLCDLFFECAPVPKKRRTHFHKFMLEVHAALHELRKAGQKRPDVASVAEDIVAKDGQLFVFDEFQVTDVGDAMILRVLLRRMFELNAVLIATSNRRPSDLYKNGLQRESFVPCIKDIEANCHVYDMDSTTDFRMLGHLRDTAYIVAEDQEAASRQLDIILSDFTQDWTPRPVRLITQGREVQVPMAAKGVARFTFQDLCSRPLGPADYLAISRAFHTVIVSGIPRFTPERLTEMRRFISFIDVMYDTKVKIFCSAAAPPFQLMAVDKSAVFDEVFAFDRTASRLNDMQSEEYKQLPHKPPITGDGLLPELRVSELLDEDLEDIWMKYDRDGNGVIDPMELRILLEDISEAKAGHRNVDDSTVNELLQRLDLNKDGVVQKEEFKHLCAQTGVGAWYI